MTALQAVALYAGINLLLLTFLSVPIGLNRIKKKISIGDGGDPQMTALIRAHGNAAEWIPGALIGLFLMASLGYGTLFIHIVGVLFTIARGAHGYAFVSNQTGGPARRIGAGLTLLCYLVISGALIWKAVS